MREIRIEPLRAEAFRPFGEVVSPSTSGGVGANQGTATRFDHAARLAHDRPHATPNLALVRSMPRSLPLEVRLLEQHPHSSQLFAPLKAARYLVCVAPTAPGGGPDVERLRAFVGQAGEGVNYAPGVWHHPFVVLDAPADLLMLVWEDGSAGDCVEHPLAQPLVVIE